MMPVIALKQGLFIFSPLADLDFHPSLVHSVSNRSTVDKEAISVLHTFNYTLLISLAAMCPFYPLSSVH